MSIPDSLLQLRRVCVSVCVCVCVCVCVGVPGRRRNSIGSERSRAPPLVEVEWTVQRLQGGKGGGWRKLRKGCECCAHPWQRNDDNDGGRRRTSSKPGSPGMSHQCQDASGTTCKTKQKKKDSPLGAVVILCCC